MRNLLRAELKQSKPFSRPASEAFLSILRTAAVLEHHLAEVLRPFGITPTQYNVLRILRGAGSQGLCGREVAARAVSKVPDISRLLDRMDDLGLIRRERDPDDRRHVTARISEKGIGLLEKATPELMAVEAAHFGGIEPRHLQLLIDALGDIRAAG